ncbi:MAG: DUF5398 family protein [Chlamydiales bacterium]|nr:DUF5398 family protein [Chlamydiales bacterium]
MYGLEGQQKRARFEFDLEKDIKKNKQLSSKIMGEIDSHLKDVEQELKGKKPGSDDLAAIAYAYKAAKKVISNIH